MTTPESALYQRLRERQQENARLYTKRVLPHWLSPLVRFLGLHFAEISLAITFGMALMGWISMSAYIVAGQKAALFL